MHHKKILIKLFLGIILTIILGFSSINIKADSWHKGIPNVCRRAKLWKSNLFRSKDFDFGKGYMRYLLLSSDSKIFGYSSDWYTRNKKMADQGSVEGTIYNPVYKKTSANKYIVKGTKYVKSNLNWQYIIQKNGKKHLKEWMKGNYKPFYKWTYMGTFTKSKL
ncbi:hypothetical protein [Apilactobacillus xinyiensis]|uniref:hypothetical protein n=1 Tax=Apilactobacillus xinyiensis TaxID=2841032 RepID=UPI002010BBC1|nr:hypothetical protein [Apilactobacillus xinyiensis]MCL0330789.1 hypothetical protein [Apilactobacillus xinyiensis]